MTKRINKSVSIGENIYIHLEDYARKYFQNNISMCITFLLTKQLEELGYKINCNVETEYKTKKVAKININDLSDIEFKTMQNDNEYKDMIKKKDIIDFVKRG